MGKKRPLRRVRTTLVIETNVPIDVLRRRSFYDVDTVAGDKTKIESVQVEILAPDPKATEPTLPGS